ncbi:hypothetical protein AMTRI_Chr03g51030 [Amborella trichopoda]
MQPGGVFRCLRNFSLNFSSSHDALTTTSLNGWSVVVSAKAQTERERVQNSLQRKAGNKRESKTQFREKHERESNPYYPFSLSTRSSPISCPKPHLQISQALIETHLTGSLASDLSLFNFITDR